MSFLPSSTKSYIQVRSLAAKRKDTEDQQKSIRTSRRKSKSSNKKKNTRIFKHQDKKEGRRVGESVAEYYERIGRMKSGPASKTNGLGDFSKYKLKISLKPFAVDENEILYFK